MKAAEELEEEEEEEDSSDDDGDEKDEIAYLAERISKGFKANRVKSSALNGKSLDI